MALPLTVVLVLLLNRTGPDAEPAPGPAGSGAAPAAALPALPVDPPPAAAEPACRPLLRALPSRLDDRPARSVRSASRSVAAWGEPPVVLRCGVPRPAGFVLAAPNVVEVNRVTWFVRELGERNVWTAVDRPVYVEVTVPATQASAPVAVLARTVADTLPARRPRPGR